MDGVYVRPFTIVEEYPVPAKMAGMIQIFIGGGTPYYISEVDVKYYMTEHRLPGHSLWRFEVEGDELQNITPIY